MLATIDWAIIVGFLILIVSISLRYTKEASQNIENFFLGGRNMPWLLAGVSMVATTFAADTPLAVTELVGDSGIAGNWLWWNFLAGGMLTTFFFAKLWKRSGVLTEVELIELRYGGKVARFLRGFKAVYLGAFMNILIIAWVNVAMQTILIAFFDISTWNAILATGGIMLLATIYSSFSGLKGVAVTDAIQFVIAMVGCILLAIFVLYSEEIGGVSGLKSQLNEISPDSLNFIPAIKSSDGDTGNMGITLAVGLGAFLTHITIQWWASWYPGAEPGGGGYVAQRMMSTRNEKDAVKATLFFQIAHYCIRPWPWIIVGLCAIVFYTGVSDKIPQADPLRQEIIQFQAKTKLGDDVFVLNEKNFKDLKKKKKPSDQEKAILANQTEILAINQKLNQLKESPGQENLKETLTYIKDKRYGFVFIMKNHLPNGLLGLLLVAFLAAYMSTISTQLNWGASYLTNDLYKRFIRPEQDFADANSEVLDAIDIDVQTNNDKHYVWISRLFTILLMFLGLGVSFFIESISGVWGFIINCGAGLGLVLILRWYWWRINAWSELAATITPFIVMAVIALSPLNETLADFPDSFLVTTAITTLTWIVVTFLTRPTPEETLKNFYQKVKPQGRWEHFANNDIKSQTKTVSIGNLALAWGVALIFTYSILFFLGKLILAEWTSVFILLAIITISAIILNRLLKKIYAN